MAKKTANTEATKLTSIPAEHLPIVFGELIKSQDEKLAQELGFAKAFYGRVGASQAAVSMAMWIKERLSVGEALDCLNEVSGEAFKSHDLAAVLTDFALELK